MATHPVLPRLLALLLLLALLVALPGGQMATARNGGAAPRALAGPGLLVETVVAEDGPRLLVRSPGRFELQLDQAGIAAWYDLEGDPSRQQNLVDGPSLLAHGVGNRRAAWRLLSASPVLVHVAWEAPGLRRSYTIWAGGQVQISSNEAGAARLARRTDANTGAALQAKSDGSYSLFLGAWTGEDWPAPRGSLAGTMQSPPGDLLELTASDGRAELEIPVDVGLRGPRVAIAGWPGPEVSLRRGDAALVQGQDYVAHWDAASGTLTAQIFSTVPVGADGAMRSFSFLAADEPALSLGVEGRNLTPEGLLEVDGNLPDNVGALSTLDSFFIPYIQNSSTITVTGAYQGAGVAGVEFVLAGQSRQILGEPNTPLAVGFELPGYGEYRLDGYLLDAAGNRLSETPADSIAPLALGRIIINIGDSITAGQKGEGVGFGGPNYPVTTASRSPVASSDGRNFFQYDNRSGPLDSPALFYRGFQVSLNNLLTACSNAPVFILNNGHTGLRLGFKRDQGPPPPPSSALAKLSAYRDQIQTLGARYVIIGLGTNDGDEVRARSLFREQYDTLIDGLWPDQYGLTIWLSRIPYNTWPSAKDEAERQQKTEYIQDYNEIIIDIARDRYAPYQPVLVGPDFYSYFQTVQSELADGIHPNQAGYESMAKLWAGQVVNGVAPATLLLPCEQFAGESSSPQPPVDLAPRLWMPVLNKPAMVRR
jgi:lysophospholipase L1-like esterase